MPIGVLFFINGIFFLIAFRNFNDEALIEESIYSRLDDSEDYEDDLIISDFELQ